VKAARNILRQTVAGPWSGYVNINGRTARDRRFVRLDKRSLIAEFQSEALLVEYYRLIITNEDLRCPREGGHPNIGKNIRILVELMSPERAIQLQGKIKLVVTGGNKPHDSDIQKYFAALHTMWPLWLHFIARDDSLEFLVRALYADASGQIKQEDVKYFVQSSVEAVGDYYETYGIPLNAHDLELECLQYFIQRGMIQTND